MSVISILNDLASPWATMLDASFRGVKFHVVGISDRGEKALVVHEYPYRSGAEVEDLGRRPRGVAVKAIFWQRNYLAEANALVKAFEESGKGELVHPLFGTQQVCVRSWSIEHEAEKRDYAAVDFEFIEASLDNPFFDAKSMRGLAATAKSSMLSGLSKSMAQAQAALAETLAPLQQAAAYVQGAVLTELRAILDVYDGTGAVVRSALSYIDYPVGFVTDLLACQFSAASTVSGLGTFAGLSALSGVLPRVSLSSDEPESTYAVGSSAYGASWVSGPQSSASGESFAVREAAPSVSATATDAPASRQTARAQAVTYAMLAQTNTLASATADTLEAEVVNPTMTPGEVEALTGNTRARVQDCLTYVRASLPQTRWHDAAEGLRDAAQAIQQLGEAALNARPPLVTHTVTAPCNPRLLAFKLYGDHTRARELVRINPQVRNPNFIAKGQEMLVYAK